MTRRLPTPDPASLGAVPALALLLAWVADDGGYAPTTWYPGTLLLAGLLVAVVIGIGARARPLQRSQVVALAALGAYAGWSYASMTWAEVPADALEGANRTLTYVLAFALFAVLPWSVATLRWVVAAFVLGCGAIALVTVLVVAAAADPSESFVNARLSAPLGYQNASAALWTMCAVAAVVLAAGRELPWAVRAALVACTPLFGGLGLMAQSRGWAVGLPIAALAALAFAPGRLRMLVLTALPAIAVALIAPTLLDVYDAGRLFRGDTRTSEEAVADVAEAFDPAARALVLAVLACLVAGAALIVLDRLKPIRSPFPAPGRGLKLTAVAVVLAVTLGGGLAATGGDPAGELDSAWESFKQGDETAPSGASRFTALGSSRYDFWRVGWEAFEAHPIAGLGQDNYAHTYLREGSSSEMPRWVHSLPLRLLTHTGIVGALLFGAFLAALAVGAAPLLRAADPGTRAVAVAALVPLVVWLVQGVQDWFWEYPALSVAALAFAAAVPALREQEAAPVRPRLRAAASGAVAVVAVVALVAPWMSARLVDRAVTAAASDPQGALERLADAADWNPWDAEPAVTAGVVATRFGRPEEAVARFREAVERDPAAWFPRLQLGLLLGERDPEAAEAQLERARREHPRSRVVERALEALRDGSPLDVREVNRELAGDARKAAAR